MLKEAGAIALNWKESALSMNGEVMPELSFMLEVKLNDREIKFAVKIQPPLLMDSVGRGYYKKQVPNRNASMRLLYWYIKARLEAVRFGMEDVFEAFMSRILHELPDGKIVTHAEVIKEHPEVLSDILPSFEIKTKALPSQEVRDEVVYEG